MDDKQTPARGGLFGQLAARPKAAFWAILVVGLLFGFAIGAAAGSGTSEVDAANDRAARAGGQLDAAARELNEVAVERDELQGQVDELEGRAEDAEAKIERLTAKAPVPDFTGQDVDAALSADVVTDLDWNVKTRERPTGDASPGTVISQSIREGRTLKSGASVTLTVAKKPPPKPPEWVTIASFSGQGSEKTDEFRIPRGVKARVSYEMVGDTNSIIELADPGGDIFAGDLLLNEIGSRSGTTRVYQPGRWYMDVDGGSWTVNVQVFKRPG